MKARKTIVGRIDPEVLLFTTGKDPVLDVVLAEADCIGSAAHVTMLSKMALDPPIVSAKARDRVVAALVGVIRAVRRGKFKITRRDQDVHLAVERMLTTRLGDVGKRIHTARSRNDQVAVDLRLYAKEQLLAAMDETLGLAGELLTLARRHVSVPMVGRTHMLPAMPSSVGLWAAAHVESLLDDLQLVSGAYALNDRCPLGSAAGYGVPLGIDRALVARLLGFSDLLHNVLYACNARGKCEAAILSAMTQTMLSLSRLAEDLILYTTPEFRYFTLPAEYCTGSSMMPQKRNPDVLELVRGKASKVMACFSSVAGTVKGLPSGYSRDLQETKEPFIDGMQTVRACLRIMQRVTGGLTVNRKALLAGFGPEVFATDRALEKVVEGQSFRDAYDHVKSHLQELRNVDPQRAVARKTHVGATAGLDFKHFRTRLGGFKKFVNRERRAYHTAISKLLGVKYPGAVA